MSRHIVCLFLDLCAFFSSAANIRWLIGMLMYVDKLSLQPGVPSSDRMIAVHPARLRFSSTAPLRRAL